MSGGLQHTATEQTNTKGRGQGWLVPALVALVALVLMRGGPEPTNQALAEMVTTDGVYTMMTTDGGNDEILVVVDSSEEMILVYRVGPSGGLDLIERERIDTMFTRARAQSLGRP